MTAGSTPPAPRPRRGWSSLAVSSYVAVGAASVVLGATYLQSSRFLSYHRDAVGADWETLDTGTQSLVRALIHVGGGGWLACGLALIGLAVVPIRRREAWAEVLAPVVGLAVWVPTLWATVEVTDRTDAVAPWYGAVAAVLVLIAGVIATAAERARSDR